MKPKTIPSPDINHLSLLANLPLTDQNKMTFGKQLASVASYIGEVQKINLEGREETAQVTGKVNEFREDSITPSLSQSEALSQTRGKTYNGFFVVPQVIKHD